MFRSVNGQNSISSLNALFSKNKKNAIAYSIASLKWQYKVLFGIKKLFLLFHMMEGEMVASVASIEGRACMLDGGP